MAQAEGRYESDDTCIIDVPWIRKPLNSGTLFPIYTGALQTTTRSALANEKASQMEGQCCSDEILGWLVSRAIPQMTRFASIYE